MVIKGKTTEAEVMAGVMVMSRIKINTEMTTNEEGAKALSIDHGKDVGHIPEAETAFCIHQGRRPAV